jgi:hypothetical protein
LLSAYDKIVAKMNKAGKAVQNLNAKRLSGQKLSDKEQRELKQSTIEFRKYQDAVLKADASIGRFQRNVGNYPKALGALTGLVRTLLPALGVLELFRAGLNFAKEAVALARDAKGVEFAFKEIEERTGEAKDAFLSIKQSARGLLSDLDIKKSIVEFDNFNLSVNELDTVLEFVAIRAAQTGKSFEYLRDSAIEAISKESVRRADNLGLSQKELNDRISEGATFLEAFGDIAKREIKEAGDILDDASNSQEKFNAAFENFKISAGSGFLGRLTDQFYELGVAILTSAEGLAKDKSYNEYLRDLKNSADETIPLYIRQGELTEKLNETDLKYLDTQEKLADAKRFDIGLKNKETEQLEILLAQYQGQIEAIIKYKDLLSKQNKENQKKNDISVRDIAFLKEQISLENKKLEGATNRAEAKAIQERIELYQKEIDAILGRGKATKKANEIEREKQELANAGIENATNETLAIFRLKKELEEQVKEYEKYINLFPKGSKEAQIYIDKIKNLKIALGEITAKDLIDTDGALKEINDFFSNNDFTNAISPPDEATDKWEETFTNITNVATQAFGIITALSDASFAKQFANLEAQKENSLKFAGDSAEARLQIEEQYEAKRREIDRKQAIAKKNQALFDIAINTARAVVAALTSTPPNVPLSIAVGALGGIQAALVASQEIPAFKTGVRGFEGGNAILGDGGVSEYVRTPDGNVFKTPSKDTLYNLPKGTDVFKNKSAFMTELRSMTDFNNIMFEPSLFGNQSLGDININGGGLSENVYNKGILELKNTILSQPTNEIFYNENGIDRFIKKGNARTRILNNVQHIKSRKV